MKIKDISFQQHAITKLRGCVAKAMSDYKDDGTPQVVSYTAPTGAGKTIIMASLIERIFSGDDIYPAQPEAVFVWLSDSPELNKQSRDKIESKADHEQMRNMVIIDEESFSQEELYDGYIYFLNTQKLGRNSKLTHHSDNRQWTIWETLSNTVKRKGSRLYVIIDEAHRGMREGQQMAHATTIMQKFLKGSEEDRLPKMPVVIGMTATSERFNNLVANIGTPTMRQVITTAEEVRSSGLLKDRIILEYPDTTNMDMAVLQAAADDWKDKVLRWEQYCREQHSVNVNPVMVIQVQNGTGHSITLTDLNDCLRKIEERTGWKLKEWEVVHTFGQTTADIDANGLKIHYVEPSQIQNNRNIKIVFFKENLSTGWDCPRAETMMSFRRANDATYIAQLLGRMVRTPIGMRIMVDETLNDVRLFLPYFDTDTVNNVINALQADEANSVFKDNVYGESVAQKKIETLSVDLPIVVDTNQQENTDSALVRDDQPMAMPSPIEVHTSNQPSTVDETDHPAGIIVERDADKPDSTSNGDALHEVPSTPVCGKSEFPPKVQKQKDSAGQNYVHSNQNEPKKQHVLTFDRKTIIEAINAMGLLTYDVRSTRTYDYLRSLFALSRFLTTCQIDKSAQNNVRNQVVGKIKAYIDELKQNGNYDELQTELMKFRMNVQTIDVYGNKIKGDGPGDILMSTDADIERQFNLAEAKLCNEGIGNRYGHTHGDIFNPNGYKTDIILFVMDEEQMSRLKSWAENEFHKLADASRLKAIKLDAHNRKRYNDIVSDSDKITEHSFQLPEAISTLHDSDGLCYRNHLYANQQGEAWIKLNSWEAGVINEEARKPDFVCWLRNLPRKPWALTIPYNVGELDKPMYPDFIIIRKDDVGGYIVDVLEPHDPSRTDNLDKAKGFARYAIKNQNIGRLQMIRQVSDATGNKFKRLDMTSSAVRPKVLHAITNEELNHIFDEMGFTE